MYKADTGVAITRASLEVRPKLDDVRYPTARWTATSNLEFRAAFATQGHPVYKWDPGFFIC